MATSRQIATTNGAFPAETSSSISTSRIGLAPAGLDAGKPLGDAMVPLQSFERLELSRIRIAARQGPDDAGGARQDAVEAGLGLVGLHAARVGGWRRAGRPLAVGRAARPGIDERPQCRFHLAPLGPQPEQRAFVL